MVEPPKDKELLIRFGRNGDESAFETLVRRWEGPVLAHLAKSCGDLDAAHDLRQEVFLRVYRYGRSYDPRYAFTTWFYRLVRNVLLDWRHKKSRGPQLLNPMARDDRPDERPGPRLAAAGRERAAALETVLARLTPEERQLLLLRLDQDLSYRAIGDIVGAPETTVKSRVYALLARLRAELEGNPAVDLRLN